MLSAEVDAIRRRDPDLDAGDITTFTLPLLVRALGVLAVGVVPLIVIRNSGETDALLVPLVGRWRWPSSAPWVVAWLVSIVISGLVVMVLFPDRAARIIATRGADTDRIVRAGQRRRVAHHAARAAGRADLVGHRPTHPPERRTGLFSA
ncbi:MAG: hypothetical protein ABWY20_10365 [Mycobacterium sp.]